MRVIYDELRIHIPLIPLKSIAKLFRIAKCALLYQLQYDQIEKRSSQSGSSDSNEMISHKIP
jgi:hypothetical protein